MRINFLARLFRADMATVACPTDCTTAELPSVAFEDCNPGIFASEIQTIYIGAEDATNFTTVTSAIQWTDRIANDGVPPAGSAVIAHNLLRELTVIGDVPAPTATTKDISGGRTITTENKYICNFTIDDVSDLNWQFGQKIQCGKGAYPCKVWLVTKSGHVIGGKTGIVGKLKLDHILPRGADGIMTLEGVLTFITTIFPNRDLFPLA